MSAPVSSASPEKTRRALSQARLDRIARPTATYHDLFPRWLSRLSDKTRFSASEMKTRLQEVVGPRICRLRIMVVNPPDDMTAEAWESLEQELQEQYALADALTLELEMRAGRKRTGPSSWAVRKASAPPLPVTENPDPFASE